MKSFILLWKFNAIQAWAQIGEALQATSKIFTRHIRKTLFDNFSFGIILDRIRFRIDGLDRKDEESFPFIHRNLTSSVNYDMNINSFSPVFLVKQ